MSSDPATPSLSVPPDDRVSRTVSIRGVVMRLMIVVVVAAVLSLALPILSLCVRPGWPMPGNRPQHSVIDNNRGVMGWVTRVGPFQSCKLGPAFGTMTTTSDSEAAPAWALQPPPATLNGKLADSTCMTITSGIGWPSIALRGAVTMDQRASPSSTARGYLAYRYAKLPNGLPAIPYWPGLITNTLLFAIPIMGLWHLISAVRRRRRRGYGACVECGYPWTGLAAGMRCPECGVGNKPA